jgi:hypothetical protein
MLTSQKQFKTLWRLMRLCEMCIRANGFQTLERRAVRNVNSGKQILNSAVDDGIERYVDSRKQLINPVVVDEVVRNVNSREKF